MVSLTRLRRGGGRGDGRAADGRGRSRLPEAAEHISNHRTERRLID